MRKTDRKRSTNSHNQLLEKLELVNQILVDREGKSAPVLTVDRSPNIRWNRALFNLEADGLPLMTDKTVEEIQLFLDGVRFIDTMVAQSDNMSEAA